MAASGLLALLDDIATMSKIAAKKTAAISGDDLAVNSKGLIGIDPKRELPIVYKVAKGSFKNKFLYLIPGAMGLSLAAPWAIMPLLTLGGAYLCYEAVEKLLHKDKHAEKENEPKDMIALEKKIIRGAIKTDLILSAEIVVVTLGAVAAAPLLTQLAVLAAVGAAMTVGIYGLVGGIVKLDDIGLHLAKKEGNSLLAKIERGFGKAVVAAVPHIMKGISILGTAAMFMVGGGLVLHGLPAAAHAIAGLAHIVPGGAMVHGLVETAVAMVAGAAIGLATIPAMKIIEKPLARIADFCKKIGGKFGKKTGAANDNGTSPLPVPQADMAASPNALQNVPDLTAAHNAAARPAAEADLGPPKQPSPRFRAFEKLMRRHFGA